MITLFVPTNFRSKIPLSYCLASCVRSVVPGNISLFIGLLVAATVLGTGENAVAADDGLGTLKPFLTKYCIECHGAKKQENDKRFDKLGADLSDVSTLTAWQGILDQLNLGEMPPKDRPQPDAKETAPVIKLLTARLKLAYAMRRSTGAQTVVRRLNRFELRNTIRDLLYIKDPELRVGNVAKLVDNNGNGRVENTSSDPFRAFPGDEVQDGFDNIGNRLVMSDFLLKLMFDAAEESLALATVTAPRPDVAPRHFAQHISKRGTGDIELYARELYPEFDAMYRSAVLTADDLRSGVRTSARYRITVEVSGHNQKHPWSEVIKTNQDEPLLVGLRLYKTRTRNDHISLKQVELPANGQRVQFSVETWIDEKWLPQISWENGPSTREARTDLLMQKFLPDAFRKAPDRKAIPDKKMYDKARADWSKEMAVTLIKNYKGPHVRVHSLTLEPLIDQWPPRSHSALYGTGPPDSKNIDPLLLAFAQRAFRRPVSVSEVAPYAALVRAQLKPTDEKPVTSAIRDLTFKAYAGSWSKLPDFSKLKPIKHGKLPSGLLDLRPANLPEHFGMLFEGKLDAPKMGEYEFQIASDDGSRVLIDGKKVLEHDGLHGASNRKAKVKLTAGLHKIRVEYFAYGTPNSLQASWSGPGFGITPLAVSKSAKNKSSDISVQAAKMIKALQVGYTAILCSPDFLYLNERRGKETDSRRLNNYEIASRLSYFLWSSMPDSKLMELAKGGSLSKANVLQQQVDRMLDDPRSAAFTRHFTERWLRLDKLSDSPPERAGPFRVYWDRRLEPEIVSQTDAYFADILKSNGPIRDLIDSDYTYLNESIATVFYGRTDVKGEYLRKVPTNDRRRGGIFTQPSVMTATANGVDTSPVVRGVWVLENILGTPPAPPPPDVEPLSPDLRSAKTIRDQLALHRKQDACNSCHKKIDPMGFAFENFDPIGRWRDKYPKARENIDASTTTSNGQKVDDIVGFKQLLLEREDDITRCMIEKLLAYATGRLLEPTDRGEVDDILRELRSKQQGLRDLIKLVVRNEIFLSK
jgi:hypothetical protein